MLVAQIVAAYTEGEHARSGVLEVEGWRDEHHLCGRFVAFVHKGVVGGYLGRFLALRCVGVAKFIAPPSAVAHFGYVLPAFESQRFVFLNSVEVLLHDGEGCAVVEGQAVALLVALFL